jgi:hypothetical protein
MALTFAIRFLDISASRYSSMCFNVMSVFLIYIASYRPLTTFVRDAEVAKFFFSFSFLLRGQKGKKPTSLRESG